MSQPVVSQSPVTGATGVPPIPARRPRQVLTKRQKAAVIVRLLLKEGAKFSLDDLPEALQIELTHEMGALRSIDKDTLDAVVAEFIQDVNDVGAAFPGGIENALELLNGALSPDALRRLRLQTGVVVQGDPWKMIEGLEVPHLAEILQKESIETSAVVLAKLPVPTSAAILGHLPGELARRITYAVSTTGAVDPETVRTIGHAIATEIATAELKAFEEEPVSRVGAMLNFSRAETRDRVLDGLVEEDESFATQVRKAIFTFNDIETRITPRDVPKITRAVDQQQLVTAIAAALASEKERASAEFILNSMSKRMSEQIREDAEDLGRVKPEDGETAMAAVVGAIRDMEQAGELTLVTPEG